MHVIIKSASTSPQIGVNQASPGHFKDALGTRLLGLRLELENTWHAGHSPTYWTLGVFTVSGTAISASVNTDPGQHQLSLASVYPGVSPIRCAGLCQ